MTIKAVSIFAVGLVCAATLAAAEHEIGGWADVWRIVVMALAGATLCLLVAIIWKYATVTRDKGDLLIKPLGFVAASYFLAVMFVGVEVAGRWGHEALTWRTPAGTAIFMFGIPSLLVFKRRLSRALDAAQRMDATVKVTVTDTSKPGADIDLTTGAEVKPK